jgi:peptidoglycan hydrolase CwlO-like protein
MLKEESHPPFENSELSGQIKLMEKQLTEKEEKIDRLNREIGKLEGQLMGNLEPMNKQPGESLEAQTSTNRGEATAV